MAREWTPAQRAAIDARNADILVSAAAGSGKTAVLVERIIERMTDNQQPVDIDRLLVVTFTNAAAAEMRQRIGDVLTQRLEKDPENALLLRQLTLLPKASITTIHSYCLKVLRANFNALGLDPNFRIANPTENELLRHAALEEVIEEMYDDPVFAGDFLLLTEAYLNIKNPDPFYELINHIYDFAMSLPKPAKWLQQSVERLEAKETFDQTPYSAQIMQATHAVVAEIITQYDAMLKCLETTGEEDFLFEFLMGERRQIEALNQITTYDDFFKKAYGLEFLTVPKASGKGQSEERKKILSMRDKVKKNWKENVLEKLLQFDGQKQLELLLKLKPLMRCMSEVVRRLMIRFDEKKEEKNLLNYNDLEHNCYRLFVDEKGEATAIAQTEQQRFDEILIDEYQDTSALQEAIFGAIKKERALFLVGDVKQSIYRFRNTNPKLFKEKKDSYSTDEQAEQRKIILSNNFRSRACVLDAVNFVFGRVMSEAVGEITYDEEEKLYPGAPYPAVEHPLSEETELWLVELSGQDEETALEAAEAEAILAAKRIHELIENHYQVAGKEGVHTVTYRDFCILMRTNKWAPVFCKTLTAYGIPCYSETGDSFLESNEIAVMMSLLRIIDNPHQDIPLLCVLRSQMFSFSADELAAIRLADRKSDFFEALTKRAEETDVLGERLQKFLQDLSRYREKSRVLNIAELVWYLYMQTGFYEAQATLPAGAMRRQNLRLLHKRAGDFEKTGLKGLYSFINFIDEYKGIGGDFDAARSIGEEQNVVRVMSIHKSKGLEFPVVILAGLGHQINMQDIRKSILIHSEWGYGPKYIDTDLGLSYENCARTVVKRAMEYEALSEELRVLYVAMTRAREKLIMLASRKNIAGTIQKYALAAGKHPVPVTLTANVLGIMDWLIMALLSHPDGEVLREKAQIKVNLPSDSFGKFTIELVEADALFPQEEEEEAVEEQPEESAPLPSLLNYKYAHRDAVMLPAKITVTEVKRRQYELESDSIYLYERPRFLMPYTGKLNGAEIGTVMHTVMENLDFNHCESCEAICEQINSLQKRHILSPEEVHSVDVQALFALMNTTIGQKLQSAERVEREISFAISVEAEPIFGIAGQVMLQGMIDCLIFDGDEIILVDYKTDRKGTPETIKELYKVQLDCYALAVEKMYGKKVSHKYLYLFQFNKEVEL